MTITNQTSLGLAGIDIFSTHTDQRYALGTRVRSSYGSSKDKTAELVYIKATAALTSGYLCELPLIAGTDSHQVDIMLTTTTAATATGATVGNAIAACVPATTFASADYGWAFVKGLFPLFVGTLAVAQQKLYTTGTAGLVDDSATTHQLMQAFVLVTVGGSNAVSDVFCGSDLRVERIS